MITCFEEIFHSENRDEDEVNPPPPYERVLVEENFQEEQNFQEEDTFVTESFV